MDIEKQRLAIKDLMREYATKHTAQSANKEGADEGNSNSSELEPIAIVGLEGYLPGCQSVAEFWQHLDKDESLIEEIPQSRFDWRLYADEAQDGEVQSDKMRCRWGGFIPDIQSFDPHFFKLLPDDAERMDPQQRLLLMSVYNTLENAGYCPQALKGSNTGVFVGFERNEYLLNLIESGYDTGESLHQSDSMIANNISYYFDFSGPSEVVNTMCSGAAVAIHRAVVALRAGEIEQAIVGAANLLLRPDTFVKLSQSQQMSPTPTVKSFGEDADGYLRAEGVASILLKPYSRARKDGDAIYAVIKNSAVNYNGNRSASIAAPNTNAHA
ncbi:polyketide synthase, partial [Pseudoalteromonas sp. Of7M-16]